MAAVRWSPDPRRCSHSNFIFAKPYKTDEILILLWSKSRFAYKIKWKINILTPKAVCWLALLADFPKENPLRDYLMTPFTTYKKKLRDYLITLFTKYLKNNPPGLFNDPFCKILPKKAPCGII